MPIKVPPWGPKSAKLYIVGEAPGKEEEEHGKPFVGSAGLLLSRMCQNAGVNRAEARINNVVQYRPPGNNIDAWWPEEGYPNETVRHGISELLEDIRATSPNVILLLGGTPLRAFFGHDKILKWRGSHLEYQDIAGGKSFRCIPTLHPAYILRQPEWEYVVTADIRRAGQRALGSVEWPSPAYSFELRPSFSTAIARLNALLHEASTRRLVLSVDLETRSKHIACVGIAWSRQEAISIPLMCIERRDGYFSQEEEVIIVEKLRELLMHENVYVVGQNFPYDTQYLARYHGIYCKMHMDTMTGHHSIFSMQPKSLDFLSSIYLEDHVFWKDDGKNWDPRYHSEDSLWRYNCEDAVRTYGIAEEIKSTAEQMNYKKTPYGTPMEMQHRFQETALRMMLRGVRVDFKKRAELQAMLEPAINERVKWLSYVTGGTDKMANSPKQLCKFFYEDMGIRPVMNYKKKPPGPTVDDDALEIIKKRDPIVIPICEAISEIRTMKIFSAVCHQEIDHDGRMRCSYNVPGTNTYRFNSKEDAFGYGTNLQNISTGKGPKYADFKFDLPNLRSMYIPDEGYIMGDYDGAQADARVVAWEARDEELKAIFRDPTRDLHIENAKAIFGGCTGKSDPRRQLAKTGVHAANYFVTASVLAGHLGITVHEADNFLSRWYGAHPAITEWHKRIRLEVSSRRYVENAFGYRCYFFGRIDDIFKEALAWGPQSTVAIMINEGMYRVWNAMPEVHPLLQTHDSGTFQFPLEGHEETSRRICELMQVEIPFEDPLVIPIDAHLGTSWGACK